MNPLALPPFPSPRKRAPALDAALKAAGITLRPAVPADLPMLVALYRTTRAAELLLAPWDQAQKHAFADDQFRLQHTHFVRHFARADFWIVEQADKGAVGRLYLDRTRPDWRIVDILLDPATRQQGIGTALLRWVQACAGASNAKGVALHVLLDNPRAHALYRRLGFVDEPGGDGLNLPMRWTAIRP